MSILIVEELKRMLLDEANLLEQMVHYTMSGGWSTENISTMQQRATYIRSELVRLGLLR